MQQRGHYPSGPEHDFSVLYDGSKQTSSVFPGKPTTPNPYNQGNLAVQRSLMEIFDEFTRVISGELKSMNMESFDEEQRQPPKA
jgi:hypothetical protein